MRTRGLTLFLAGLISGLAVTSVASQDRRLPGMNGVNHFALATPKYAEMLAFYAALRAFDTTANDPAMQWRHVLAPGEAMLFDNWRVLHGRTSYTGHRHLCGAYINHEDYESRLRLADASGA